MTLANRVQSRHAAGTPTFGLIATIPSIQTVQILALPGQYDHPRVQDAVARAEAGILRSGVALGGVARTPQEAKALLDRGYRAIVLTFDWMLLQRAAVDFLQAARAAA